MLGRSSRVRARVGTGLLRPVASHIPEQKNTAPVSFKMGLVRRWMAVREPLQYRGSCQHQRIRGLDRTRSGSVQRVLALQHHVTRERDRPAIARTRGLGVRGPLRGSRIGRRILEARWSNI
jgi:hypothetical protein